VVVAAIDCADKSTASPKASGIIAFALVLLFAILHL